MLGSGGWDAAGWLAGEQTRTLPWGPIHLHGALGALRSQPGDWLTERLRPWAPFGGAAMTWEPWRGWALKGQVDSHGPLYRGSMMPLGQTAVELRLIGRAPVKRHWRLELGFSEDIAVGTAPDITLHAHLGRAW
jgi:hypothetical protein